MHPRLTVLTRVFERPQPLEDELTELVGIGVERIGIGRRKLLGNLDTVHRSGLEVTHVGHGSLGRGDLPATIEAAVAVGSPLVYGPASGAPELEWEMAADRFVAAIEPAAVLARGSGVELLIEPTLPLFADISLLHTLADTVEIAERAGIGVCIDVQHCWSERRLRQAIARAGQRIGLVQLSDWIPGARHHFRAVPGDGAIPLERIVGWILECGYRGYFDLELYPEPGVLERETVARGLERGAALLERLGA